MEGNRKMGESFRVKREEMNLTLKEVENATSIRMNYLQAIEEGRVQQVLSSVYALGFLRQYATFLGFDPEKTEIFLDTEYIKTLYKLAIKVAKRITYSTAKAVFGFNNETNIGSIFFTSIQSAPAFLESERHGKPVPCLIPCAIDQDAHFRVTRDVAEYLGYPKPALILCKLFPSLAGSDKMSASKPETSIFTTDPPKVAKKKIMNAFTGGQATVEEQKEKGGNPDVCSVYQYLSYVFEEDDKKIKERGIKCRNGEVLCGECKGYLANKVGKFLLEHQKKREKAKDIIEDFMIRD